MINFKIIIIKERLLKDRSYVVNLQRQIPETGGGAVPARIPREKKKKRSELNNDNNRKKKKTTTFFFLMCVEKV